MDKQAEKDRSDATTKELKVIAIKLPSDLQERILAFPFLHAIRARYPAADLHLITPSANIEVLNLLPFTAYYHECNDDELRTVFDVHRYCAFAKIYNVDLYISLTDSFPEASLGLGLRAKTRVGFSDKWKKWVLTHSTTRPTGHHLVEDYFSLFKVLTGADVDSKLKVTSRDLNPILKVWDSEPYLAINASAALRLDLTKLISLFDGQRIVLFSGEGKPEVNGHIDSLIKTLPKKNLYHNYAPNSWIELAKMLAYSRGVVTHSGAVSALSAYTGSRTLVLYDQEDPQRSGPFYFLADVNILVSKTAPFEAVEVFKRAQEFFNLLA
ncbi:MAG TPA: glycosyltransferase family 9 protein [Bacteriovoracaceae bacterium]|nr:glycosyltransferase family 9 protein [Bacteriovoracaceae bacterium]